MQSLGQNIDTPSIVEGELSTKPDEMAFHAESANLLGVHVGDTVTLKASEDEGTDGTEFLLQSTFKVTALVENAEYAANSPATYGFTLAPSGTIDGLAWVVDDAFDESAFFDAYSIVNIRCDSLAGMDTFSDEYKRASNEIQDRLETLGATMAEERFNDLRNEGREEVDDAKKEIADGEEKIKDGEEKIEKAKQDIADGEQKVADGELSLANSYAQIANGEQELYAAQSQYDSETAAVRAELDKTKSDLDAAQQSYDESVANLNALKAQYEQAKQEATTPEEQAAVEAMRQQIDEFEPQVAAAKAQLDEGWQQYNAAVAQFEQETAASLQRLNEAEAQLSSARYQVAQGEADLANARQQLEDGKKELADKQKDLEQGKKDLEEAKADLADAEESLDSLLTREWSVLPRSYNSGVGQISMFSDVTNSLSISMASLFIIVGLLVSYFAVSRIINEHITQIGTKKALGFRRREVMISYLCYTGIAVFAAHILGVIMAYFLVERIVGNALGDMFSFGQYDSYIGWGLFCAIWALEFVLVLGATYLACRRILKKHAIDLLHGSEPPATKERFYEKWGVWARAPLFIQTIVNNCMNDKRRVLSTIVGVAGCTALIVTAITLNNDVVKSYYRHYENVYSFNAIAYVDYDTEGALENLESALRQKGATTARVYKKRLLMEQPNGESGAMSIIAPVDEDAFNQIYHMNPVSGGEVDLSVDGAWVSQAYGEHFGAKVGDIISLDDGDGGKFEAPILGFQEFGLTFHEMVVGKSYYEKVASDSTPTAVLVQTGDIAFEDLEAAIADIEGFDSIVDDASKQKDDFDTFSSVSGSVVFIYLVLATIMAVVVLLNLNIMFIDEKKRELIVLMINGFSVKDARHYISYDNVVLTAFGIIAGLVLGCIMGAVTVASVEPVTGSFVKSVDGMAVIIGVFGSAVLSLIMSLVALRRINSFKLIDVSKF